MLAVVFYGARDLRIEDIAAPEPAPGEVQVKIAYNGLCGADLKEYFLGPMFIPAANVPVVIGHEASGTVTWIGEGVFSLRLGDRVAIEPVRTCGNCRYCVSGSYNLCDRALFNGYQVPGTLAEYAVVPEDRAHKLPESVSLETGALTEPMSVAMHAVLRGHYLAEGKAVVYGGGPIGIGVFLGLRAEGVQEVAVVEPSPTRRKVLEALGCEHVLNPATTDVVDEVLRWTNGAGADVSYDAAGAPPALLAAAGSTAKGGDVVIVAAHEQTVDFDPNLILLKEVNIKTSSSYAHDFPRVLGHMAGGSYPTKAWVEHVPLDEVSTAIEVLRSGRATKILVDLDAV